MQDHLGAKVIWSMLERENNSIELLTEYNTDTGINFIVYKVQSFESPPKLAFIKD